MRPIGVERMALHGISSPLSYPVPIKSRSKWVISRFHPVNQSTAIGHEIRYESRSYNWNWRDECEQGCRSNQGRRRRREKDTIAPYSRHLGFSMSANARSSQQRSKRVGPHLFGIERGKRSLNLKVGRDGSSKYLEGCTILEWVQRARKTM